MSEKILVIGANGQIGTELVLNLRVKHGVDAVVASDIHPSEHPLIKEEHFELVNVLDKPLLETIFETYKPTQVYLLAAILSATGEKHPQMAWDLNMNGLLNVLDLAVKHQTK